MKKLSLISEFKIYQSIEELQPETQALLQKAIEARKNAYAPYSNFKVGAAILLVDGTIIIGSNQENAAYPSGLCAERVAIYQAGALYPTKKIKQIAISAGSSSTTTSEPVPPCGACRQALVEYEIKQNENIAIFFMGEVGEIIESKSINNLLPLIFNKKLL
ncbi:cytidine deaminase [Flavobacterium agrisoli]|uniref:Cytidine deaminase n=1 Tax=Flavobacterium agrisoli TaxID=2793066 RepID=A0A934UKX6_9FLAO|nr:cytidine deaminase [Flavobacterium agrisoli]MBK0371028.1 cytidine deaminase [Flavobacterium agrisoli]